MKSFKKGEKKHKDPEKSKTILIIPCLVTILVILIMFLANAIFLILVRGDVIATTAKPIIEVAVADANKTDNINSYYTVTVKNYNQNDEVSEVSFEYQIFVNSIDGSDLPEYTWYDSFGNDMGTDLTGTFFHSNKQDQIYTICFKNAGTQDVLQNIKIESKAKQKNLNEQDSTVTLASVAQVGDYVNYNAASGNGAGKSYTTDSSVTGYSSDTGTTFSSSDTMTWKVMSVDKEAGTVELMAEDPTESLLWLKGKTGYKNAETVLNDIGAVYGYGEGATGGRSITIEDVNKLENYTPEDDTTTSYTYTSGTFINEDGTETVIESYSRNEITLSYTQNTEEKSTNRCYSYTTTNFSGKTFWLASRCIVLDSAGCGFHVRRMYSGDVENYCLLCNSYGYEYSNDWAVLPVVSLKSNIQTSGQDESGAWNLVVE